MTTTEKINIALPAEMGHNLRMQGITALHGVWQDALNDKTPGISADDVLERLERKYQAIASAARSEM